MIIFKAIRFKNFFSYPNVFSEIPLRSHQTTLIRGKNGTGKSTFLDAITFCLFNRAFREDVNKAEVVNDLTNKECCVEIEFTIGNKEYKVVRGIKPNIFEVWCGDTKLNQNTDSRDYQEILEKQILRCNFKSFCQVVILGSDTYVPFMKLSVPKRREIIEGLLDLDVFSSMSSLLKGKITDLTNLNKDKTCEREKVEQRISLLEMSREELRKNNDTVIREQEKNKEELFKNIKESKDRIETLRELIQENVVPNIQELDDKIRTYEAMVTKCRTQMDTIQKEIDFLSNHETCPTCRQKIETDFREETLKKRNIKNSDLQEIYEPGLAKIERLREERKVIDAANKQIAGHRSEMEREFSRIEDWRNQIAKIDSYVRQLAERNKKFDDSEIDRLRSDTINISREIQELNDDAAHHRAALTILPLIKAQIIKKFVPIFNEQIKYYLNLFEFPVKFEINENFEETMTIRGKSGGKGYGSLSAGQKFRVDIALLFAWRSVARLRNSVNVSLLVLDEIFDSSLDSDGQDQFMEILSRLHEDTNVYLISHHAEELVGFDRNIEVSMKRNFSQMRIT